MQGIANVRLEVISTPPTRAAETFAVQVQAFAQRSDAEHLRDELEQNYGTARIIFRNGDQTWRVLVGLESTVEAAKPWRSVWQRPAILYS